MLKIYNYLARLLSKPLTDKTMDLLISYLIQEGDYLDEKMYRTRLVQEHYMKESITNIPNFMIDNDTKTIINLLSNDLYTQYLLYSTKMIKKCIY